MKRLFASLESHPAETRAAVMPATVKKLKELGLEVSVEKDTGFLDPFNLTVVGGQRTEVRHSDYSIKVQRNRVDRRSGQAGSRRR